MQIRTEDGTCSSQLLSVYWKVSAYSSSSPTTAQSFQEKTDVNKLKIAKKSRQLAVQLFVLNCAPKLPVMLIISVYFAYADGPQDIVAHTRSAMSRYNANTTNTSHGSRHLHFTLRRRSEHQVYSRQAKKITDTFSRGTDRDATKRCHSLVTI